MDAIPYIMKSKDSPVSTLCHGCSISPPPFICNCDDTPVLYCQSCLATHLASRKVKHHERLTIDVLRYDSVAWYRKSIRKRLEIHHFVYQKLKQNLTSLDLWKREMTQLIDYISKETTAIRERIELEIATLLTEIRNEISETVRELEQQAYDIQSGLTRPVTQAVCNSQFGIVPLLTCNTDFEELKQSAEAFLLSLSLRLQTDLPGFHPCGTVTRLSDFNPNRKVNIYESLTELLYCHQAGEAFTRLAAVAQRRYVTPTLFRGPLALPSGEWYIGEWSAENTKHGLGVLKSNTGTMYVGRFANDRFDGLGYYILENGEGYAGAWKQGVRFEVGKWFRSNELFDVLIRSRCNPYNPPQEQCSSNPFK